MQLIVIRNKRGYSLVEVMIALVLSLLVFMALMQTSLVGIESNMKNVLRDEAIAIAEMRLHDARGISLDDLASDGSDPTLSDGTVPCYDNPFLEFDFLGTFGGDTGQRVQRNIRNIVNFDFCTNLTVNDNADGSKTIVVTVIWEWKREPYRYIATTVRRPL